MTDSEEPKVTVYVRAGWLKHRILAHLKKHGGQLSRDLKGLFKVETVDLDLSQFEKKHLEILMLGGFLTKEGHRWVITADGLLEVNKLDHRLETGPPRAAPRTFDFRGLGLYDGKELKRNCLRPGAYDAFDKPSLYQKKAVFRDSK